MTIGTYTTCDQPKAPFFPWIILGWILHFLLMYVYTRISKYIPEGEEFKAVDLPYGQALKIRVKNKWSISFGDIPLEEPFLKNNKEFTKIGSDAHKHILSHLDAKSLAKSERVSKDWYRLATTPKLWGRFRWARTFNKNVKNKKLLFVKASITLIIVLCFTEVFLQYVLFGYRIKENLPVEPKCVENADFTNYPHNCCSGNFCADVDDSELTDFVVHPCCGAADADTNCKPSPTDLGRFVGRLQDNYMRVQRVEDCCEKCSVQVKPKCHRWHYNTITHQCCTFGEGTREHPDVPTSGWVRYRPPCTRPDIFCTRPDETFVWLDCDGDGAVDPMCSSATGEYGGFMSDSNCDLSWDSGDCPACSPSCSPLPTTGENCPLGDGCNFICRDASLNICQGGAPCSSERIGDGTCQAL